LRQLAQWLNLAGTGQNGVPPPPVSSVPPPEIAGSLQYAASEIAADEIAAKNWPPMQRAAILYRRLAFRRHQFTPTHK